MIFCGVSGCDSDSSSSANYTFHPVPSSLTMRAQWVQALGPLRDHSCVCSRHFDDTMFTNSGDVKTLIKNAMPKLFLYSPSNDCPVKMESSDELVACRACLAADGRLYAISGSGLEDSLAALTGIALSTEHSLPRHLCVYCMATLSKCAAFRDSCQRSTSLLQALLEKGPLKMSVIEAYNRKSQTNKLTCNKLFQFGSNSFIDLMPLIKTENNNSHEEAMCAEVFIESGNFAKKDASNVDNTLALPINTRDIKVEEENENDNAHSEIDDCLESEVGNDTIDDTDTSKVTLATYKNRKRTREILIKNNADEPPKQYGNLQIEVDEHPAEINTDTIDDTDESKVTLKTYKNRKRSKVTLIKMNADDDPKQYGNLQNEVDKDPNEINTHTPETTTGSRKGIEIKSAEADLDFEKKYNFNIKLLSKEEQKQRIENRKNNQSAFSCEICGKAHWRESFLAEHKTVYHNPSLPVECDVCFYRFRSRKELWQHQILDHHRAELTCNECGYVTWRRTLAKDHCLMHRGKTFLCPPCGKKYNSQGAYFRHLKREHPGECEACDECGATVMGKVGLLVHKKQRHNTSHMREHTGEKPYQCEQCLRAFSFKCNLLRHENNVHLRAQAQCQFCFKTLGAASLRAHVRTVHMNLGYVRQRRPWTKKPRVAES